MTYIPPGGAYNGGYQWTMYPWPNGIGLSTSLPPTREAAAEALEYAAEVCDAIA